MTAARKKTSNPGLDFAMELAERVQNKKGEDTLILDLQKVGTIADFLILTSVDSAPQLRAISEDMRLYAKKKFGWKVVPEGSYDSQWIILDLGPAILHVMDKEMRNYYKLEDIWSQGAATAYYL